MPRPFARASLVAALGLAIASSALAQSTSAAAPAGTGQTGILIGRPPAAAPQPDAHKAAYKNALKDASRSAATAPTRDKPAPGAHNAAKTLR